MKLARVAAVATLASLIVLPAVGRGDESGIRLASRAASLFHARTGAEAVTLDDGRVLVVGGWVPKTPGVFVRDAELYDPLANAFVLAGRMLNDRVPVGRIAFQATKLADGRVLVSGGYGIEKKGLFGLGSDKRDSLASAHVFDPRTNAFTSTGSLRWARHSHTATLLSDGRVLIAGGYPGGTESVSAPPPEVWDPKTGQFTALFRGPRDIARTSLDRTQHVAVPVDRGERVLLIGGLRWDAGLLAFLKIGKPRTTRVPDLLIFGTKDHSFGSGQALARTRTGHAAVALATGEVVVAGGQDERSLVAEVETWENGAFRERAKLTFPRTGARMVASGSSAVIVGGVNFEHGIREVPEVEVFDGATGRMRMPLRLIQGRAGAAVARLEDGRILVVGGAIGATKSLDGSDGQAVASCEIFEVR